MNEGRDLYGVTLPQSGVGFPPSPPESSEAVPSAAGDGGLRPAGDGGLRPAGRGDTADLARSAAQMMTSARSVCWARTYPVAVHACQQRNHA
jgi:hypothetical protein